MLRLARFTVAPLVWAWCVLLPACASHDSDDIKLVSAINGYYKRLQDCHVLTAGKLPRVKISEVEDLPPEYKGWLLCLANCLSSGSCPELYGWYCQGEDGLAQRCEGVCAWPTWQCANGELIPWDYRCDGEVDCADGSDEVGCPAPELFQCGSGETIPASWVCDLEEDCADGSDEAGCAKINCPE